MDIFVPVYDGEKFSFVWEEDFSIKCSIDNNSVIIEANKGELISLARHLLELAQENVPEFEHIHLDEYNSLDNNSAELTVPFLLDLFFLRRAVYRWYSSFGIIVHFLWNSQAPYRAFFFTWAQKTNAKEDASSFALVPCLYKF